ncbi:MAG TPA: hypothetical protein VH684_16400 [Xanthobacteraceae bacterium]
MNRISIGFVLGIVISAGALLLFGGPLQRGLGGPLQAGPLPGRDDGLPIGTGKDFSDGLGIYYLNDGKYNYLYWKKKLFTPGAGADPNDIAEAGKAAIPVKKGVRFFTYGLDISRWEAVPPYVMAFCVIREMQSIEGIHPIRIKPVDRGELIYELLLPPVIDTLGPGTALWTINYQYSCQDGWVFKFE